MFGRLGLPELILILAIALIIFGPRKLPEIGKSIGKGIREFKSATAEVQRSVNLDEEEAPKKKGTAQQTKAAGEAPGEAASGGQEPQEEKEAVEGAKAEEAAPSAEDREEAEKVEEKKA